MNGAFVHLSLNHIPVVGFRIFFFILLAGNLRRSRDLVQAGYVAMVLFAIITFPVWKSGGPAARIIRGNPDVVHATIHEHAEAAEFGGVGAGIMGVIGLIGWWLSLRPEGAP